MAGKPKGDEALRIQFTIPMSRAVIDRLTMEAEKTGESKTALARCYILTGLGMEYTREPQTLSLLCTKTNKIKYASEGEAVLASDRLKIKLRPFLCRSCKKWHILAPPVLKSEKTDA